MNIYDARYVKLEAGEALYIQLFPILVDNRGRDIYFAISYVGWGLRGNGDGEQNLKRRCQGENEKRG